MVRRRRWGFLAIARIVMLFCMGLVVAFIIAISQIDLEKMRGSILSVLQNATGLPVEIDGAVSWKLSLRPRIELNKVRVPNAEWAKHKDAFVAEKIDVTLDLISLFQARPTIQNVKIYDATVCLEKNTDGVYSVLSSKVSKQPAASGAQSAPAPSKFPFEDPGLGGVEVHNLTAHIVDKSYKLTGFQIRYIPTSDSREYSGWIKNKTDVFPFILTYSPYNAERKVYPVRVAFGASGDALIANVALEGTSHAPIDFIVKGNIPDIAAVGRLLNVKLSNIPTVKVNMAGGLDRTKLTLRKSSIVVRGNELTISGNWDFGAPRQAINLDISSKSINLVQVFPTWYDGKWVRPDRELNAFKDTPLFGRELSQFNIKLHAKINNLIVYRDLDLRDIDLTAKLVDNIARVDATLSMGGGQIELAADGQIDGEGRIFAKAAGRGRSISVGQILTEVRETDLISELPTNFDVFLEGNGTNLSELMSTVTGPVQIKSADGGYAYSTLVSYMYGTDFLTTLRHAIQDSFSSEKKHNRIKIKCVALNAKLRNGVFDTQQGVAVETNAINLRLAGRLNLGAERLRMALTTVPVRGLKLSLTGNVVNSIEITGNLAEPDIKISGAAVAGKVASATGLGLLLAPLTGGIGLVAGAGVGLLAGDLLENWLADDHPCETAMQRGAPSLRDDPEWMGLPVGDLQSTIMKTDVTTQEEQETKGKAEKNV